MGFRHCLCLSGDQIPAAIENCLHRTRSPLLLLNTSGNYVAITDFFSLSLFMFLLIVSPEWQLSSSLHVELENKSPLSPIVNILL